MASLDGTERLLDGAEDGPGLSDGGGEDATGLLGGGGEYGAGLLEGGDDDGVGCDVPAEGEATPTARRKAMRAALTLRLSGSS